MIYCIQCHSVHDVNEISVIFKTAFKSLKNGVVVNAGCCKEKGDRGSG